MRARRFVHVVVGPRQVGKTTPLRQVLERRSEPYTHATGDEPEPLTSPCDEDAAAGHAVQHSDRSALWDAGAHAASGYRRLSIHAR